MFGDHFYHGTLHRLTKAFGNLFNNIYVVRYDSSGNPQEKLLVPLNYSARHTYIARRETQPALEDDVYVETIFPRLAYELISLTPDPSRKLITTHQTRNRTTSTDGAIKTQYQSVPWNVHFRLTAIAKHVIDANQIFEQIVPYFQPSYTVTLNSIPPMGYLEDIPIDLVSVDYSDNYSQELNEPREVIFVFNFTAKIHFWGPINTSKIIRKVQVDLLTPKTLSPEDMAITPRSVRHIVEVDPPDAEIQDDFGYTETYQEFNDNKKYNPVTGTDEEIS